MEGNIPLIIINSLYFHNSFFIPHRLSIGIKISAFNHIPIFIIPANPFCIPFLYKTGSSIHTVISHFNHIPAIIVCRKQSGISFFVKTQITVCPIICRFDDSSSAYCTLQHILPPLPVPRQADRLYQKSIR